jgi:hypothetical protein
MKAARMPKRRRRMFEENVLREYSPLVIHFALIQLPNTLAFKSI